MKAGWDVKQLGEVCNLQNGFAFKSKLFKPEGVPVLRISSIQDGKISDNRPVFTDPKDYPQDLNRFLVKQGDLLIAMSGATTGKIGFNDTEKTFLLNQRVGKFEPLEILDIKFLAYFLSTKVEENLEISAGAAQPNLSTRQIKEFLLPFPSLEEQKRIVALLDEAFAGLDRARAHTEANLQNAKDLFEQTRMYILSSFTESPKLLGDFVTFHNGDRGKNYPNKSEYVQEGIPWLNTGHIAPDGTLKTEKMNFITREKYESLRGGNIQEHDLLFCLRGATIGKTAFVKPYTVGSIASSLMIIRPSELILGEYLYHYLVSDLGKEQILRFIGGAAQPNLAGKNVALFEVPLPPINIQKRMTKSLELAAENLKKLQSVYQTKLTDLDDLRQSLLQKAFAGELT